MMKTIYIAILTCTVFNSYGQADTTLRKMNISGYLEPYYSYDFSNPSDHIRPSFFYSFNRHNEVNLNLGYLKANYESNKSRANLALMTGTYVNSNLQAEPGVLKNIYEANVGLKLSNKKQLWIDVGIFPSHIGFESAIGSDCWNLTRSILAENSPYFESGAKITYISDNQKWLISGLILNGWQRIQRVYGNNLPSFGHQIQFKPNSRVTINSSSFIGSDTPDSIRKMRYFHNFFVQIQLHKKFGLIAGFDIGIQQKEKESSNFDCWYSPIIIAKYSLNSSINIAARVEYYSDKSGIIINTGTLNGFQTFGYSTNLDYNISSNLMWRIEARFLKSRDNIFTLDKKASTQNYFVTTSLALSF